MESRIKTVIDMERIRDLSCLKHLVVYEHKFAIFVGWLSMQVGLSAEAARWRSAFKGTNNCRMPVIQLPLILLKSSNDFRSGLSVDVRVCCANYLFNQLLYRLKRLFNDNSKRRVKIERQMIFA